MKKLIFLLIFLPTSTIKADYVPPSLNQLILKADKIVYGETVCVDESVIEVSVHNSILHDSESITIVKFKEWNCGRRWMEYKVGDTSLFFLKIKNGRYRSMGGGNEGELPLHNDKIYVHASTISKAGYVNQFDRSEKQMQDNGYNNPYNGYVMDLKDFWEATTIIKNCFTSEVNNTGNLVNIEQLCASADYEASRRENKILNWAISKLKS